MPRSSRSPVAWRWMPHSPPTAATRARRWRSHRSPTCCSAGSCVTIPPTRRGPTATGSSCRTATRRSCSTRCSSSPATASNSTICASSASGVRQTPGHPEAGHTCGIEVTTGPLGQGFANSVGMAIAERNLRVRFGEDAQQHHTFVIAGDGCMMEGISHEAASLAGHLGLSNLICVFDDNHITIDGATDLATNDDVGERFRAYGWNVVELGEIADDLDALESAVREAMTETERPSFLILRTHVGFPSPDFTDDHAAHGNPFKAADVTRTKKVMGIPDEPFWAPDDLVAATRANAAERGASCPVGVAAALGGDHRVARVDRRLGRHRAGGLGRGSRALRHRRIARHPQGDPEGARPHVRQPARPRLGFGRSQREQRHRPRSDHATVEVRSRWPLHPLRHPRTRHGCRDGRHGQARRRAPRRRHVLRVLRLHEAGHQAGVAVQGQRLFRVHPRLGRCGRGRPDAPAGRASRRVAGDPRAARDPPGRWERDDRRLGGRRPSRRADGADPQPPEHRGDDRRLGGRAGRGHRRRRRIAAGRPPRYRQ